MKTLKYLLIFSLVMILVLAQAQIVQAGAPRLIRLNAENVKTAVDIEAAIQEATLWGTRPGKVVLDGSRGPFEYVVEEGNDYTINLFYSNISLVGINDAVFTNSHGIMFDGVPADNIKIQNFTMHCVNDCIIGWGYHKGVLIQHMKLYASGYGVQIAETEGWVLTRNVIQVGGTAVDVIDAQNILVTQNQLSGFSPVTLYHAQDTLVRQNKITGGWVGVALLTPSSSNHVIGNQISGVELAGIVLEDGTFDNDVIRNMVTCAPEAPCQTVLAQGSAAETNRIIGNLP
jgi:hypothetical protein